jgi:pimeloyl-ACP methyl ester carboxylesterase
LWGSFPDELAAATGAGVFVYSRAGYGKSSAAKLPRSLNIMQEEALATLPKVLAAIGFQRGILLGHSDGASIATIYTGSVQDHRVRGLVLIAPHFFAEQMGLDQIRRTEKEFAAGGLRKKLERWHADAEGAFRSWSEPWLDPKFRHWDITEALGYIRVPILIVQGKDDQYGTLKQLEVAREECFCPGRDTRPSATSRQKRLPRLPASSTASFTIITKPKEGQRRGCRLMHYSAYCTGTAAL